MSIHEQVKCVEREITLRKCAFPKWVAKGRLTQEKSDHEIACMQAVLETLKEVAKQPRLL